MGFNIDLLAIRGKSSGEVYSILKLRATPLRESEPESPVVAASLPSGWQLIYFNDRRRPSGEELAQISDGAEAIALMVCEAVTSSCASAWQNGQRRWIISHDADRGADDLTHEGEPPNCFVGIAARMRKQQQEDRHGVSYIFGIPVEVFHELTGFSYDGNPSGYPVDEFIVLERINPPRPWWRFW